MIGHGLAASSIAAGNLLLFHLSEATLCASVAGVTGVAVAAVAVPAADVWLSTKRNEPTLLVLWARSFARESP